jgi:hypothetical protein
MNNNAIDILKKIIIIQKHLRSYLVRNELAKLKDGMTKELLYKLLDNYIRNYHETIEINKLLKYKKCRNENFPSHISENIAKFAIYNKYGIMPNWDTDVGDLKLLDKKIEVKGFMSDGPSSFGPTENWCFIYFVDCKDFINYNFKVYEIKLSNKSEKWRGIRLNKTETFGEIADNNQRGKLRFSFYDKHDQIKDYCTMIFNGNMNLL